MHCSRLLAVFAALTGFVLTTEATAYDSSWYRTDFWAGEYPSGFTLKEDVTTKIRNEPLPGASRSIDCALKKGETYHPWNGSRVKSSNLDFISYVKKATYRIKSPATILLHDENKKTDLKVAFRPGDTWTWLTYYGEGVFRMVYRGKEYAADQSLLEVSEDKADVEHEEHEWLKLTCANGARGWLLVEDVKDELQFEMVDFPEYGKAMDRPG
jgi:hypothetical protein